MSFWQDELAEVKTHKKEFLAQMNRLMLWGEWVKKIETTAANVHDTAPVPDLLEGTEEEVFGDSGYLSVDQHEEVPKVNHDGTPIQFRIKVRRSSLKKPPEAEQENARDVEHAKSSIRSKAEYVFAVVKGIFDIGRRDCEACQRRMRNCICCSPWRTCSWPTVLWLRPDGGSLVADRWVQAVRIQAETGDFDSLHERYGVALIKML